jgi:hypothetical protein
MTGGWVSLLRALAEDSRWDLLCDEATGGVEWLAETWPKERKVQELGRRHRLVTCVLDRSGVWPVETAADVRRAAFLPSSLEEARAALAAASEGTIHFSLFLRGELERGMKAGTDRLGSVRFVPSLPTGAPPARAAAASRTIGWWIDAGLRTPGSLPKSVTEAWTGIDTIVGAGGLAELYELTRGDQFTRVDHWIAWTEDPLVLQTLLAGECAVVGCQPGAALRSALVGAPVVMSTTGVHGGLRNFFEDLRRPSGGPEGQTGDRRAALRTEALCARVAALAEGDSVRLSGEDAGFLYPVDFWPPYVALPERAIDVASTMLSLFEGGFASRRPVGTAAGHLELLIAGVSREAGTPACLATQAELEDLAGRTAVADSVLAQLKDTDGDKRGVARPLARMLGRRRALGAVNDWLAEIEPADRAWFRSSVVRTALARDFALFDPRLLETNPSLVADAEKLLADEVTAGGASAATVVLLRQVRVLRDGPQAARGLSLDGAHPADRGVQTVFLAMQLWWLGHEAEARRVAGEAEACSCETPAQFWLHAVAFALTGRLAAAVEMFARARALDPRFFSDVVPCPVNQWVWHAAAMQSLGWENEAGRFLHYAEARDPCAAAKATILRSRVSGLRDSAGAVVEFGGPLAPPAYNFAAWAPWNGPADRAGSDSVR